ncbi:MAG: hypothetical protein ACRDD7_12930 [Peptostreptococcaceae bacterium]
MNDKVNQILKMQSDGMDIKDIAAELNYKSVKPMRDYMRKKGYSCQEGKFSLKEDVDDNVIEETITTINEDTQTVEVEKEDSVQRDPGANEVAKAKKNKSVSNNEIKVTLDDMKKEMDKIKYYMMKESFTVRFELPMKSSEKSNPTSVRLYKDDKEAFDNLCKTKFKDINKDALFSMAIREFVEKYKD